MLKFIVRLTAAIGVLVAISSSADATCPTFTTLTNGTTADANAVMNNFNNILGCPYFTGNVGIGTPTPSSSLDVYGLYGVVIDGGTGNSILALDLNSAAEGYVVITDSNGGWSTDALANDMVIRTQPEGAQPAGRILFNTNGGAGASSLAVNGSNVGIGTTTPGLNLDVHGAGGLPATSGTTQTGILQLSQSGTVVLDMGINTASPNGGWLQSTNKTNLSYTYPLLLNPNGGNVGIGTTTPSSALQVNGTATATTFAGSGASLTNIPTTALTGTLLAAQFPALAGDVTTTGGSFVTTVADIQGTLVGGTTGTGNVVFSASPTLTGTLSGASSNWSGNVGIGTSTPVAPLTVQGGIASVDSTTGHESLFYENGPDNLLEIRAISPSTTTQDTIYFQQEMNSTGTPTVTTPLVINPSGYVGVNDHTPGSFLSVVGNAQIGFASGTAAPANGLIVSGNVGIGVASPSLPLTVLGDIASVSSVSGHQSLFLEDGAYNVLEIRSVSPSSTTPDPIYFQQQINSTGTVTTPLVINPSGYVGVNDHTPGSFLSVVGNAQIGFASGTAAPTSGLIVSGNVGIGTASPLDQLSVYGTSAPSAGFYNPTWSVGQYSTLVFRHGATVVNGSNNAAISEIRSFVPGGGNSDLRFYTTKDLTENANPTMVVTGSGDVGVGTTSPGYLLQVGSSSVAASTAILGLEVSGATCTHTPTSSAETVSCSSDARLKKDIVDASATLPEFDDMRVRNFTVRATGETRTGVIAQELQKNHPEMVHMGPDGFYTVDGPNPWKLVKAIQELKSANDAQASQIARQNQELADLKRENALLKSSASTTDRRLEAIEARLGIRAASLDRAPMRASGNHE